MIIFVELRKDRVKCFGKNEKDFCGYLKKINSKIDFL